MSDMIKLFESILGKKPDAYLHEPIYQVTESEVVEFSRAVLAQEAGWRECATCGGKKIVDDGELTCSAGGIPYANGPIRLVKDCPDCAEPPAPAPECQDLREQYEAWADANGYDIARNEHGDYAGLVEDSMWSGWKAKAEHWSLPERIVRGQSIELDTKAIGWNSCLAKFKELNP